jgi:hypothetical protein
VLRCDPPLPDKIGALEEMLTKTRDLSGFVVALRRKFKEANKSSKS